MNSGPGVGVPADTDVFGDDQVLYLLKPRKPGDSGPVTQALRTADGVTLTLDSLEETLPQRLQVVGRYLLLKSEEEKGTVLRLHDPLRGRDVWRHEAGPNAVVLRSLVPELVGVATAAGEIQIVELTTGRQVFTLTRPGEQIAQAQTIYLLGDSINWYVVFNLETKDPAPGLRFRLNYNMAVMRSVEVNGPTIAVDRRSGQVAWQVELPVQNLILEQFDELPLLLCSSYQEVRVNPGGNNQGHFRQVSALVAVDKRDGRIIDRSEAQSGSQFFALRVDAAAGRIDLIGHPYKATYQLRGD